MVTFSVLAALFAVVACDDGEGDAAGGEAAPRAPQMEPARQSDPQVSQAGAGEAACEDFGTLGGTSLKARASGPTIATSMTVANRPVKTRLAVSAYGARAALVGQTVDLGTGKNASMATCTHCIAIAIGCTESSCSGAAWFYPRSGRATFTDVGAKTGESFSGSLTDVILEQVKVDSVTMATTPIPGGACIRLPSLQFAAIVEGGGDGGTTIAPTDAGSTSGDRDDAGTGSSDSGGGKGLFASL